MMNTPSQLPASAYLRELNEAAAFARHAKADATVLAYARDFKDFERYCAVRMLCKLPAKPETIAAYLASLVTRLKLVSMRRHLVAISQEHKHHGFSTPTAHPLVRAVLMGIARNSDVQVRSRPIKKTALTTDRLRVLVNAIGTTSLRDLRDRAVVLVGWAAALRRSELAALDVGDLTFAPRGVTINLRVSKTDPYGHGCAIDLPYIDDSILCPVTALTRWIEAASIGNGPLFRTFARGDAMRANRIAPIDVARCLKRAASAGELFGDFSGHSLRRGYITSAIQSGALAHDIMRRTRHTSHAVFEGYIEEALPFARDPLSRMLSGSAIGD